MRLVGRLDHPNVVRTFDADQIHKVLYIVMEFVAGRSLGDLIKKNPIPAVEMVEYAFKRRSGWHTLTNKGSCTATSSRRTFF